MMENGKNQSVFGALTNETLLQFYKLDTDLKWHQSDMYVRNQKMQEILGILVFGWLSSRFFYTVGLKKRPLIEKSFQKTKASYPTLLYAL